MASSGKTSLGLNQWADSDRPSFDDHNSDNSIADKLIQRLFDEKVDAPHRRAITEEELDNLSAFTKFAVTAAESPIGFAMVGIHIPNDSGNQYAAQVAVNLTDTFRLLARRKIAGNWGNWQQAALTGL